MFEIVQTAIFKRWVSDLRDRRAVERINARLRRVALGNFGDTEPVGDGVSEMRLYYGPGYRLYFIREGSRVIVLLCGGDKDTQSRDVPLAKRLAAEWRER